MGMDVHDVPSASRPAGSGKYFVDDNDGVSKGVGGHKNFYKYLRLRLELQAGMVVVSQRYFHHVVLLSLMPLETRLSSQGSTSILLF